MACAGHLHAQATRRQWLQVSVQFLLSQNTIINKHFNLRSIFIDTIEGQERVGLSKEIFFVQFCRIELQGYFILLQNKHSSIHYTVLVK